MKSFTKLYLQIMLSLRTKQKMFEKVVMFATKACMEYCICYKNNIIILCMHVSGIIMTQSK
jgi:hypothetical protein